MLKNKFGLLLASGLVTAFGVVNLFSQSAWAINRPSDAQCRDRSDFFKLWNNTTIANGVCFANAGTANIRVYNVYRITNGNNYASVRYTRNGSNRVTYFCIKYLQVDYNPAVDVVTSVTLSANPPSQCSGRSSVTSVTDSVTDKNFGTLPKTPNTITEIDQAPVNDELLDELSVIDEPPAIDKPPAIKNPDPTVTNDPTVVNEQQ